MSILLNVQFGLLIDFRPTNADQDEFGIYTQTLIKCLVSNQLFSLLRVDLFADYTMASNREYFEVSSV